MSSLCFLNGAGRPPRRADFGRDSCANQLSRTRADFSCSRPRSWLAHVSLRPKLARRGGRHAADQKASGVPLFEGLAANQKVSSLCFLNGAGRHASARKFRQRLVCQPTRADARRFQLLASARVVGTRQMQLPPAPLSRFLSWDRNWMLCVCKKAIWNRFLVCSY